MYQYGNNLRQERHPPTIPPLHPGGILGEAYNAHTTRPAGVDARMEDRMKDFRLSIALTLIIAAALISACGTMQLAVEVTPDDSGTPSVDASPQPTQPLAQPTAGLAEVSLDYSAVAQNVSDEIVPAQPFSNEAPYWNAWPEYRLLTLQGYLVANHLHKPQIFIYPVADMAAANEGMAMIAAQLQTLLQTRQTGETLPYLPLYNASQVMHAQVQFLDFKNGSGVRFLTQHDQGTLPINNYELVYTFQGLTSDGRYYLSAVLPVNHPNLPADDTVNEDLMNDFLGYLARTAAMLNEQPAASFTPDLSALDALVRSIEVH